MKSSITIVCVTVLTLVRIGIPASASQLIQQREPPLEVVVDLLVSKQSHAGDIRSIATSYPAQELVAVLDDRIRNALAFAPGERARAIAFEILLQVSDFDERGVRQYTNARQVQLFIDEVRGGRSGIAVDILRVIHLVDDRFYDLIIPAIGSIFRDADSAEVLLSAFRSLGQIGDAAKPLLSALQEYVGTPLAIILPMKHPMIWEKMQNPLSSVPKDMGEFFREHPELLEWEWPPRQEPDVQLRSAAALARFQIDISLLREDIVLYRTLDPLGQHAGALALIGIAIETHGLFDDTTSSSVAAAKYLFDYYNSDHAKHSKIEVIPAFSAVLRSENTMPSVRDAWRDALVQIMVNSDSEEFRHHATAILQNR